MIESEKLYEAWKNDKLTPFQEAMFEVMEESNSFQMGKLSVAFPDYVEAFGMIEIHGHPYLTRNNNDTK